MTDSVQVVGPGAIEFAFLIHRFGGEPGARDAFEHLIADVVGIVHPDVQEVQANPGDWGIDAFVGELTTGSEVRVWQAKYFIHGFGKTQQGDVRESYASALRAAAKHGYVLKSWTLCLPIELDGPNLSWWQRWARRTEAADGVGIELWTAGTLRRRLMDDEATKVRLYYFSPVFPIPGEAGDANPPATRPLQHLPDLDEYQDALFARQMDEAGLPETYAAREAFFNAEILSREVDDKGIQTEVDSLRGWRIRVHATWSQIFNDACQSSGERVPPGVFRQVMEAIEVNHKPEADALRASVLHGAGLMHQSVDNARAGWVRDWRRVADEYARASASNGSQPRTDPVEGRTKEQPND
ncbi:hypothetical protein [Agromyces sp. NPDC058126]|uniref:hypothetical protein n=1 Tax=Agromyces sp. NPDC058126 TaxID=3346350 RepID=UPI0036D85EC2